MNGLGVLGGGFDDWVNTTELITFSLAVSNAMGGTVTFDGFQDVTTPSENGSNTILTSGSSFPMVTGVNDLSGTSPLPATPPLTFSMLAGSDAFDLFRPTSVTAQFTTTPSAVPEPGSIAFLACLGGGLAFRRRKKANASSGPEVKEKV